MHSTRLDHAGVTLGEPRIQTLASKKTPSALCKALCSVFLSEVNVTFCTATSLPAPVVRKIQSALVARFGEQAFDLSKWISQKMSKMRNKLVLSAEERERSQQERKEKAKKAKKAAAELKNKEDLEDEELEDAETSGECTEGDGDITETLDE